MSNCNLPPSNRYLGLRAGDATIGELPETCTLQADLVEVDLRTVSEADLDQMCAASCENPLQDMLTEQPGVLENRVGHFTGENQFERESQMARLIGGPPMRHIKLDDI